MQPGKRLLDKVAIVTGGASGIGAETARVFALHGATVILCDVQDEMGHVVAKEITDAGGTAEYRTLDVCNESQWVALVAETERKHGKVNVLGNIAGISGRPPGMTVQTGNIAGMALAEQTLEAWNRIMEVNATGRVSGHQERDPGDAAGGRGIDHQHLLDLRYCRFVRQRRVPASKGAVRIFSKAAAIQYAKDQIRVNSIHPGFVDTPMARPGLLGNESGKARMDATPLGRFGKPIDIAMGCLYLASDELSWVTGSELVIDGGMTAN